MQNLPDALDIVVLVALSLTGAVAQLCIKKSVQKKSTSFINSLFNPYLICGGILLVLDTIAIAYMLRRLPLIYVMPLCSLIYVFVPLGAILFFKEHVTRKFWVGAMFLLIGIVITTT